MAMFRYRPSARKSACLRALPATVIAVLVAALMATPGTLAAHPAVQPEISLSSSGNFFLAIPGPHGFVDPGSRVTVQYRVQSTSYPASAGTATIRVPASIATFGTSTGGSIHIFLPVNSFTISSPNQPSAIANGSLRLATGETFTAPNTTLNSNDFAVQASWSPGQYTMQIQWQWVVILADGTETAGPWSGWTTISPAQIATLAGNTPSSVPLGGNFSSCLTGPIAGRNFTVHFSTTAPIETFNGPIVAVPSDVASSGQYCWNSTLPDTWAPQTVQAHYWEIAGSSSFLLYQVPFQLVNGSGGGHGATPPPGSGAAWYNILITPIWLGWISPLILLILGVVIVVGVGVGARRRSRRAAARRARAAPADPSGGSRGTEEDSA